MKRGVKNHLTRSKILLAALHVFADKGYAETRTDDLALAAKVGKGTLYKHFENKQELLIAIFEKILDDLFKKIRKETADFANLEDAVDCGLTIHLEFFMRNRETLAVLCQTLGTLGTEAKHRLREAFFTKLKILETPGKHRLEDQIYPGILLEDAILAGIGLLYTFSMRWLHDESGESLMSKKDILKHILLHGLSNKGLQQ